MMAITTRSSISVKAARLRISITEGTDFMYVESLTGEAGNGKGILNCFGTAFLPLSHCRNGVVRLFLGHIAVCMIGLV